MEKRTANKSEVLLTALAIAGLAWLTVYLLVAKALDTGSWLTYLLAAISVHLSVKHTAHTARSLWQRK